MVVLLQAAQAASHAETEEAGGGAAERRGGPGQEAAAVPVTRAGSVQWTGPGWGAAEAGGARRIQRVGAVQGVAVVVTFA